MDETPFDNALDASVYYGIFVRWFASLLSLWRAGARLFDQTGIFPVLDLCSRALSIDTESRLNIFVDEADVRQSIYLSQSLIRVDRANLLLNVFILAILDRLLRKQRRWIIADIFYIVLHYDRIHQAHQLAGRAH